jgi:hypothetical protein
VMLLVLVLLSNFALASNNQTDIPTINGTIYKYLPDGLFEAYHEYTILEEHEEACNIESYVDSQPLDKVKTKIVDSRCFPHSKSFTAILENGWYDLAKDLVVNSYLKNSIDPTAPLYTQIHKHEAKVKYIESMTKPNLKYEKLNLIFDFENFDNTISFRAKLPDEGYVLEHYSVFCYKDMFKLNAVLNVRNKIYKVSDTRTFYDLIEGDCEHKENKKTFHIDVTFKKMNKYKRWPTLFK